MTKELWINLPVKDVEKSKDFFTKIGFSPNTEHGDNAEMACLQVGEKILTCCFLRKTLLKVLRSTT